MNPTKQQVYELLHRFIEQPPGLTRDVYGYDPDIPKKPRKPKRSDYDSFDHYNSEMMKWHDKCFYLTRIIQECIEQNLNALKLMRQDYWNNVRTPRRKARKLLSRFKQLEFDPEVMKSSFKYAFYGRLSLVERGSEYHLEYTAGQYYPTEYQWAAVAVLERYLYYVESATYE